MNTTTENDYLMPDDNVAVIAKKIFGISFVRPWQRLVIANTLDAAETSTGGKQIVLLPTGAGKSLCFLLPALLLNGPTLIVYPLLALMTDQRRRLEEKGVTCVMFRGNQTDKEREENFRNIKKGTRIILTNPEVLQNKRLRIRLTECSISHLVIDEAHCVAEWGDSFRPAYISLGTLAEELRIPVVTAFTATASPSILKRIAEILFNGSAHIIRSGSDRPNIYYSVDYAYAKKKEILRLAATERRPILIFCGTRYTAENIAREIAACYGREIIKFYHAGLSRDEKKNVEHWFLTRTNAILCATVAYGMGIDKPNIRTVIHFNPARNAESYVQESGRAGRDSNSAKAILMWNETDHIFFSQFGTDSREYTMKKFAESTVCRRQVLLEALGDIPAVCSGCDICEPKTDYQIFCKKKKLFPRTSVSSPLGPSIEAAADAKFIYETIRMHRKFFTDEELCSFLLRPLNENYRKTTGTNIWESNDIVDIIIQLKKQKKICNCLWPWKGKLDIEK